MSYWTPSVLAKKLKIYNNIFQYTHCNFAIAILYDLGILYPLFGRIKSQKFLEMQSRGVG
jgi:hypothetical protein